MIEDHLEKLPHFVEVVRSKSILKAAERLNIAQPALSKSIQRLEEAVGRKLLIRSRSGSIPTESGKIVFDFSEALLKKNIRIRIGTGKYRRKALWEIRNRNP